MSLRKADAMKFDEDNIDKVNIWKAINKIYTIKTALSKETVNKDEKNEILMKWLKSFISHDYYAIKYADVKDKVERTKIRISNSIIKSEAWPENLNSDIFLIIIGKTEDSFKLNGLIKLGKEHSKDKKRNKDSDYKTYK